MKENQTMREEQMMRLSSTVSYGAMIKDGCEVVITREMMKQACQKMESLQIFPFTGKSVTTDTDLEMR